MGQNGDNSCYQPYQGIWTEAQGDERKRHGSTSGKYGGDVLNGGHSKVSGVGRKPASGPPLSWNGVNSPEDVGTARKHTNRAVL
jgi:hypothetical protein